MQALLVEGWGRVADGALAESAGPETPPAGSAEAQAAAEHPTFFEVVTIMALRYFAEQKCDLVIWETGLGGRLDSTNIVTPLASVITNIQYDHQKWLGETLASIAAEKAGMAVTALVRRHEDFPREYVFASIGTQQNACPPRGDARAHR
jgi:folylpolyglutamate synthase/dihydropteroate synthase